MTPKIADRARAIEPTLIRAVTDGARASSLHLGLGQPDLAVPEKVRAAVREQVDRGFAPYSPNLGLPEAREAVARHVGCRPGEVMITVGVQEAMATALLGTVEPGDEVLVPDPGFPAYANLVRAAGGAPIPYPLTNDFDLDPEAIFERASSRTTAIVLNSPSNPTGGVSSRGALAEVVGWCEEHDVTWVSDEIYEDLVWEGAFVSAREVASDPGSGFVLSGLSKTCAMMGWRLGWLIGNSEAVEALKPLHQHLVTCAPTLAQHAAIAALDDHASIVGELQRIFRGRRERVMAHLSGLEGVELSAPAGAFYAFPRLESWSRAAGGSLALCRAILDEVDVVTIPGVGFGEWGEGHVRLAYTVDVATLDEGLERITNYLIEAPRSASSNGISREEDE